MLKNIFISIILFIPLISSAFTPDTKAKLSEAISMSVMNGTVKQPVNNEEITKRVLDSIVKYEQYLPVPRISLFDLTYPATTEEFKQMAGTSLILITSFSHDRKELPLKRVFIREKNGNEHDLEPLVLLNSPVGLNIIKLAYGEYRNDGIYLLPLYLTKKNAQLKLDYGANREDFTLADMPLPEVSIEKKIDFKIEIKEEVNIEAMVKLIIREIPFLKLDKNTE